MMEKQTSSFKRKKLSCALVFVLVWTLHSTFDSRNILIAFKPTTNGTTQKVYGELQLPSLHLSIVPLQFSLTSRCSNTTSSIPSFQIKPTTDNKNDTYRIIKNRGGNDSSYSSSSSIEANKTWKDTTTNKEKNRMSQKENFKNIKRQQEIEIKYKLKSLIADLELEDPLLPFTSCGKLNFTAPTVCGTRKCFVRVKDESNIGYLIASLSFDYILDIMTKGYNYTKYLEDTYNNIKHFSLDKPRKIPILLPCIQRHLEEERAFYYNRKSKFKQGFHPDYGLVIQKTTIAPTPHLIIAQRRTKDYYYSMLKSFLKNNVQNKTQFANRLEQEIHHTLIMLRKERCLLDDFQVLVDIYGNLYHIDLDRCFENRKIHGTVKEVLNQINATLQASIIQARSMDH